MLTKNVELVRAIFFLRGHKRRVIKLIPLSVHFIEWR